LVSLYPSYVVKWSILSGRGNAKRSCIKVTPSLTGVRNVKCNKHKLLHRIASIQTSLIYNSCLNYLNVNDRRANGLTNAQTDFEEEYCNSFPKNSTQLPSTSKPSTNPCSGFDNSQDFSLQDLESISPTCSRAAFTSAYPKSIKDSQVNSVLLPFWDLRAEKLLIKCW